MHTTIRKLLASSLALSLSLPSPAYALRQTIEGSEQKVSRRLLPSGLEEFNQEQKNRIRAMSVILIKIHDAQENFSPALAGGAPTLPDFLRSDPEIQDALAQSHLAPEDFYELVTRDRTPMATLTKEQKLHLELARVLFLRLYTEVRLGRGPLPEREEAEQLRGDLKTLILTSGRGDVYQEIQSTLGEQGILDFVAHAYRLIRLPPPAASGLEEGLTPEQNQRATRLLTVLTHLIFSLDGIPQESARGGEMVMRLFLKKDPVLRDAFDHSDVKPEDIYFLARGSPETVDHLLPTEESFLHLAEMATGILVADQLAGHPIPNEQDMASILEVVVAERARVDRRIASMLAMASEGEIKEKIFTVVRRVYWLLDLVHQIALKEAGQIDLKEGLSGERVAWVLGFLNILRRLNFVLDAAGAQGEQRKLLEILQNDSVIQHWLTISDLKPENLYRLIRGHPGIVDVFTRRERLYLYLAESLFQALPGEISLGGSSLEPSRMATSMWRLAQRLNQQDAEKYQGMETASKGEALALVLRAYRAIGILRLAGLEEKTAEEQATAASEEIGAFLNSRAPSLDSEPALQLIQQAKVVAQRSGDEPQQRIMMKELLRDIRALTTLSVSSDFYPSHLVATRNALGENRAVDDYAVGLRFLVEFAASDLGIDWAPHEAQLRDQAIPKAIGFWKPIPGSAYRTAPLLALPILFKGVLATSGVEAAQRNRRLVSKGRQHWMVTLFERDPRTLWRDRNSPVRGKAIAEFARRLGASHVDVEIPSQEERGPLAQYFGVKPEQIALSRLSSDYLMGDAAVRQKGWDWPDVQRVMTRSMMVALFLRIYDFHRYNFGRLRDSAKYDTLWYDTEQGLHQDLEKIDAYAVSFLAHFFTVRDPQGRVTIQIAPESFTGLLSPEEVKAAALEIEQARLADLTQEVIQAFPSYFLQEAPVERVLKEEYLPRLLRWQASYRNDAYRFFRVVFYYMRHPDQFELQRQRLMQSVAGVQILPEETLSEVDNEPVLQHLRQELGIPQGKQPVGLEETGLSAILGIPEKSLDTISDASVGTRHILNPKPTTNQLKDRFDRADQELWVVGVTSKDAPHLVFGVGDDRKALGMADFLNRMYQKTDPNDVRTLHKHPSLPFPSHEDYTALRDWNARFDMRAQHQRNWIDGTYNNTRRFLEYGREPQVVLSATGKIRVRVWKNRSEDPQWDFYLPGNRYLLASTFRDAHLKIYGQQPLSYFYGLIDAPATTRVRLDDPWGNWVNWSIDDTWESILESKGYTTPAGGLEETGREDLMRMLGTIPLAAPMGEAANRIFQDATWGSVSSYLQTFDGLMRLLNMPLEMLPALIEMRKEPQVLEARALQIVSDQNLMAVLKDPPYRPEFYWLLRRAVLVSEEVERTVRDLLAKEGGPEFLRNQRTGEAAAVFLASRRSREAARTLLSFIEPRNLFALLSTQEGGDLSFFWYYLTPVYEAFRQVSDSPEEAGRRLAYWAQHFSEVKERVGIPPDARGYPWQDWLEEDDSRIRSRVREEVVSGIVRAVLTAELDAVLRDLEGALRAKAPEPGSFEELLVDPQVRSDPAYLLQAIREIPKKLSTAGYLQNLEIGWGLMLNWEGSGVVRLAPAGPGTIAPFHLYTSLAGRLRARAEKENAAALLLDGEGRVSYKQKLEDASWLPLQDSEELPVGLRQLLRYRNQKLIFIIPAGSEPALQEAFWEQVPWTLEPRILVRNMPVPADGQPTGPRPLSRPGIAVEENPMYPLVGTIQGDGFVVSAAGPTTGVQRLEKTRFREQYPTWTVELPDETTHVIVAQLPLAVHVYFQNSLHGQVATLRSPLETLGKAFEGLVTVQEHPFNERPPASQLEPGIILPSQPALFRSSLPISQPPQDQPFLPLESLIFRALTGGDLPWAHPSDVEPSSGYGTDSYLVNKDGKTFLVVPVTDRRWQAMTHLHSFISEGGIQVKSPLIVHPKLTERGLGPVLAWANPKEVVLWVKDEKMRAQVRRAFGVRGQVMNIVVTEGKEPDALWGETLGLLSHPFEVRFLTTPDDPGPFLGVAGLTIIRIPIDFDRLKEATYLLQLEDQQTFASDQPDKLQKAIEQAQLLLRLA